MRNIILILILVLSIAGCKKDNTVTTTTLSVEATDDSADTTTSTIIATSTTIQAIKKDGVKTEVKKTTESDKSLDKKVVTEEKKDSNSVTSTTRPKTELEMLEEEIKENEKLKNKGNEGNKKAKDIFDEF